MRRFNLKMVLSNALKSECFNLQRGFVGNCLDFLKGQCGIFSWNCASSRALARFPALKQWHRLLNLKRQSHNICNICFYIHKSALPGFLNHDITICVPGFKFSKILEKVLIRIYSKIETRKLFTSVSKWNLLWRGKSLD